MTGADKSFCGHILLAEDDPMSRLATQEMLAILDCRVIAAADGQEALEAYEASVFDLIILDISMPVVDGLEAARRIRSSQKPEAETVPIIAMTGYDGPERETAYLGAGANGILVKPATLARLSQLLKRWLPAYHPEEKIPARGPSLPADQEAETLYLPPLIEIGGLQNPGESDIVQAMADIFLAETPGRLSTLSEALSKSDFQCLEETLHTIKGSCSVISALQMSSLCEEIEEKTQQKEIPEIEKSVQRLHEEYERVKSRLAAKPWENHKL